MTIEEQLEILRLNRDDWRAKCETAERDSRQLALARDGFSGEASRQRDKLEAEAASLRWYIQTQDAVMRARVGELEAEAASLRAKLAQREAAIDPLVAAALTRTDGIAEPTGTAGGNWPPRQTRTIERLPPRRIPDEELAPLDLESRLAAAIDLLELWLRKYPTGVCAPDTRAFLAGWITTRTDAAYGPGWEDITPP